MRFMDRQPPRMQTRQCFSEKCSEASNRFLRAGPAPIHLPYKLVGQVSPTPLPHASSARICHHDACMCDFNPSYRDRISFTYSCRLGGESSRFSVVIAVAPVLRRMFFLICISYHLI